ncbi:MAG: MmcQ/YjbR family DNA-binding protein [Clostridia bacterium]|nr:MmcQ/YjbR family DNA-binding protein [Clostridia bacterium]
MNEVVIKNQNPNFQRLAAYGFAEQDGRYIYSSELLNGQMKLKITVSADNKVYTELIDAESNEEYVLHLVSSAVGSFVGQVKAEYEAVLKDIVAKCFDVVVFKSEQAKAVISYVLEKYGNEPEYLWKKFPDNAVIRRSDTKKWYVALLAVSKSKLGIDSNENVEIIDLRLKPEEMESLIDNKKYFPGYHMNKKHWFTICLDGSVPMEEICKRIDKSYELATK